MRATEYGLLHYGNYSFTDIKSNIYAFNNEISVVNDETNENESSAYTEIIYVEIEPNDGNPNEFKLAEDGEILDYREGNYILNSNVITAMEVSDSATVFLQTLSIQARIYKFGEKYFALVTKNMAGAVAWETFLGGLEIVATQMKKKKREKITLLNDILREKQLSVVLFISKDGALLETAYQSIDNLYGNEIVLFIETNDSMNLFGSVIRIKTGANVTSSSGVPYKKLSKVVDYFNTNVSSSALQEIIKEHIADKSSGFFIVKRAFLGALNRVIRFSSDLTLEGIGKISDGIGELVGALKLDDSQWQYYDDNGLPLKNANLFLPGLGGIKYLQETNKKSRPEETNAKAINKITELEKILKESKKTLGKADFFKKIINQLLYMLRKVKDFLGDPLGKALDFAETVFVLYNAYIVGIINSIVDAIKGIFDILSIICKALAALQKKGKNIAENLPSYLSLFFEIIENMIETLENLFSKENLKALIEFFKKSAAFILTLPTRAFAWLAENAAMPNLDKVAYYYGYIIGFIIQLILEILFTGGAKTAADAFKKLADSLINIFKTMEKFVFKFSDKVIIGFENLLAIFAYIREKSKNLGVLLDEVLEIIEEIFYGSKQSFRNYSNDARRYANSQIPALGSAEIRLYKNLVKAFFKPFKKLLLKYSDEALILKKWKQLKFMKALSKTDVDDLISLRKLNKKAYNKNAATMKAKIEINGEIIELEYKALAGDSINGPGLCTNVNKDYIARQLEMSYDELMAHFEDINDLEEKVMRFQDSEHKIFSAFDDDLLKLEAKYGKVNVKEINFKTLYEPCISCKKQILIRESMHSSKISIEATLINSKKFVKGNRQLRETLKN
ncbi:MAG: hypothetical protein DCE86_16225 [Flavobacteriaceae bacterium]|uniref:hypothetical protein n=1 Tax=Flavobacterium sp. Leaf359 TaxID=1736351 RepID=UPI0006F905D4|nr:hypothetical protein [Flavobacterium sp. Leaf359]KQS52685.1 hypothetical protein ASG38_16240 [Flavobacterium sp. Leaf359]PZO24810.1 MAG: hypothetical protein DCE86_16225 [Flavobacteriaceae bacterium]